MEAVISHTPNLNGRLNYVVAYGQTAASQLQSCTMEDNVVYILNIIIMTMLPLVIKLNMIVCNLTCLSVHVVAN